MNNQDVPKTAFKTALIEPEKLAAAESLTLEESKAEVQELNRQITQQARYFDAILSSISDFAYTFDREGRFVFINQALLDLWGLKLEDAIGKNFFDLQYPNDLAVRLQRQIEQVFATKQRVTDETSYTSPTGVTGYYEYIFSPYLRADNSVELVVGTTRNITDRKQVQIELEDARTRLESTLTAGEIGTWTWDIVNNVVIADKNLARMFDLSEENAKGGVIENYLSSIHPDDRGRVNEAISSAIENGEDYSVDYRLESADGKIRWVVARGRVEYDAANKPVKLPGVVLDITERKEAEEALRTSDRRKDEFLATLAHELRNPLAPIRSGLEIIRQMDGGGVKLGEVLDIMERQTNQVVHLVDDLLDLSRITHGKIKLRRDRIELKTAIEMALETSCRLIAEAGNSLTVNIPDEPIYLDADLTRIAQIFLNVLNNAAKYSDPDGKISLAVKTAEGEVFISIRDRGLGIAPGMLSKIFDMFGQVETPEKQGRGGLGIGLNVVKKLVEMHGGTVQALSDGLGKGSEFIIRLPLAREQAPAARERTPETGKKTDTPANKKSRRILVVDDNQDAVEMMETLLSMEGHTIRTAFDGKTAIEIAGEFKPDICLCDIGLPGMNGYELAAHLRELLPGNLMISLSGWGQEEDRRRSLAAGFDHHMVKPVEFNDLLKLIQNTE